MKIYHYYFDTKEFYKEENYKPIKGLGLPAHSTSKKPLEPKEGYAIVFDERAQDWIYEEDHRGKRAWTFNKEEIFISDIGSPVGITFDEPGEFDIWTDDGWKEDETYKRVLIRNRKIEELYKEFQVLNNMIEASVANKKEKFYYKNLKRFFALLEKHEHLGGEFPAWPEKEQKPWYKRLFKHYV